MALEQEYYVLIIAVDLWMHGADNLNWFCFSIICMKIYHLPLCLFSEWYCGYYIAHYVKVVEIQPKNFNRLSTACIHNIYTEKDNDYKNKYSRTCVLKIGRVWSNKWHVTTIIAFLCKNTRLSLLLFAGFFFLQLGLKNFNMWVWIWNWEKLEYLICADKQQIKDILIN